MILMIDKLFEGERQDVENFIKMKRCMSDSEERLYRYPMLSQEVQMEWLKEAKGSLSEKSQIVYQYLRQLMASEVLIFLWVHQYKP